MNRFGWVRRKSLVASIVALPLLVLTMMVCKQPMLNSSNSADSVSEARHIIQNSSLSKPGNTSNSANSISEARHIVQNSSLSKPDMNVLKFPSSKNQSTASTAVARDRLLGGLLSPGFLEESCISRYTSFLYHKTSTHKPSTFLVSKLRNYEKLHKHCGPNSQLYKKTLNRLLSSGKIVSSPTECKYVVWIAYSGLGNKILSLVSAFLYALLTNRVLLVEQQHDTADLFCEPFPNTSWSLPMEFPVRKKFKNLHQQYDHSYGNLLKKNVINSSSKELKLSSIYLHLAHDADYHDKLFFFDQNQILLRQVPWLIMRSNNYFVPSLFLMQSFDQELNKLFPNKETVFHHLSRYLLHPSNQVWELITRYYKAYLSKADERIGLQIRAFGIKRRPFQLFMDQILACTKKEKLLPEIDPNTTVSSQSSSTNQKQQVSKAVLITSLYSGFSENLKNEYWTHPTVNGEVVGVYQPSHEGEQKFGNNHHTMQAWVEMYLLSMCDVLVTSGWSTFGYVAQGLAGVRPWMLYKIGKKQRVPDPPCRQVMSIEPCYHIPPSHNWTTKNYIDNGSLVPHVRHCEDRLSGLKLVDVHQ